jgi:hypothetical protein
MQAELFTDTNLLLARLDAAIERMSIIEPKTPTCLQGIDNLKQKRLLVASGEPYQIRQVNEGYIRAFGAEIGKLTQATGLRSSYIKKVTK